MRSFIDSIRIPSRPPTIAPEYFGSFCCTADKCPDSCCRSGWEITIDDDTYAAYKAAGASDIDENLTVGSDGDRIFRLKPDGSCPYLRDDGLCSLYILTDGRLGEICSMYPRFVEEYDGFNETGISVSCPAARELVLLGSREDYRLEGERPMEELLSFLHSARKHAFDIVYGGESAYSASIKLEAFGAYLQQMIDLWELDFTSRDVKEFEKLFAEGGIPVSKENTESFCTQILMNTEILYHEWEDLLKRRKSGAAHYDGDDSRERAYLAYLVFRFFLKAVCTEDIYTACKFIRNAYLLCRSLECGFERAIGLFSKEIEHDAENYAQLLEVMCCEQNG